MIYLKRSDYELMLNHAQKKAPEEACGLLGGRIDEAGDRSVERVYLLENTDHSPEHFTLSPKDQLTAVKNMRANGWEPLGNWHSHPASPARPSEEDKRLAYDSLARYLILSLQEPEQPVLKAFRIVGDQVEQEEITYV